MAVDVGFQLAYQLSSHISNTVPLAGSCWNGCCWCVPTWKCLTAVSNIVAQLQHTKG
jgi:hypothetical protein